MLSPSLGTSRLVDVIQGPARFLTLLLALIEGMPRVNGIARAAEQLRGTDLVTVDGH